MRVFPRGGTISGRKSDTGGGDREIPGQSTLGSFFMMTLRGNGGGLAARRFRRERANDGEGLTGACLIARAGLPLFNSSADRRGGESRIDAFSNSDGRLHRQRKGERP